MHCAYGKRDLSSGGIIRASCCNVFHPLNGIIEFGVLFSPLTSGFLTSPVVENWLQHETCAAQLFTTCSELW